MIINAQNLYYKELNQKIREASDKDIVIENCLDKDILETDRAIKTLRYTAHREMTLGRI